MENTLKAIEENHWNQNEKGLPIELCVINVSSESLDELSVPKESKYKETYNFYFSVGRSELKLKYRWDINGTKAYLFVYMHSDESSPPEVLDSLFSVLSIDKKLALYTNQEYLCPPKFQTMRVDDNSNEIEITRFHQKSTAEFYTKVMEAKGHKQLYYVQKA